ncbi:type 1 glutamine amidotransferase domain-containing protein [Pseudohalioglobus sediminis]|uniref:Type 1 glutamine amidotransferase domain-containing protein n=1 Tax=Pseudohalioglobus sediminis TaxID=2606449 RepID=A0A5B0X0H8_9GAMM|nr:type 1 glutamine amidotransferase domain-containing protein [Pseudohalioglobus sediminis]KAA1191851.1 type 1 glutamine amidotransferase domain-containing protein [Pseudohalioglobus sediminis]
MQILFVLTSHDKLGSTGEKTGFWLEEFAAPYYRLLDAGAVITLASPLGGQPPLDPKSEHADAQTEATQRFNADADAQAALAATTPLAQVRVDDYDAIFYPGGHGPLWDLHADTDSIALLEGFAAAGKPVAAVCHAPAVLLNAKTPAGEPLVANKRVTGFSNSEEAAVGLTDVVPYLLEDALKAAGAAYEKADDWQPHVVVDGLLISGQNPASSEAVADALLGALR